MFSHVQGGYDERNVNITDDRTRRDLGGKAFLKNKIMIRGDPRVELNISFKQNQKVDINDQIKFRPKSQ